MWTLIIITLDDQIHVVLVEVVEAELLVFIPRNDSRSSVGFRVIGERPMWTPRRMIGLYGLPNTSTLLRL